MSSHFWSVVVYQNTFLLLTMKTFLFCFRSALTQEQKVRSFFFFFLKMSQIHLNRIGEKKSATLIPFLNAALSNLLHDIFHVC